MVEGGTVVVIQGPRFSTRAESRWYSESGFDVVNMTQYPECWLARELELCYANVSLVTDYDVGVDGGEPVSADAAFGVFRDNLDRLRALLGAGPAPDRPAARRRLRERAEERDRAAWLSQPLDWRPLFSGWCRRPSPDRPSAPAFDHPLTELDGGHTPWNS